MNTPWDNVSKFEELIADYAGSKYAVAVDSCTNAIFLSLKYAKDVLREDVDYIEVPKKTYISVPMQVMHTGYKVKFTTDEWIGAYKLNPLSVYDSAQRFTKGMYIPGSLYCLSFNHKKTLSTGKGGMILTDDIDAKKWLDIMKYDGRTSIFYNENTDIDQLGYHMYMAPEQAVIGIQNFYGLPDRNPDKMGYKDYNLDLSTLKAFHE